MDKNNNLFHEQRLNDFVPPSVGIVSQDFLSSTPKNSVSLSSSSIIHEDVPASASTSLVNENSILIYKPKDVIEFHKEDLTEYELAEIQGTPEIFYFASGVNKRKGKSGLPNNDNYDDENKYYIIVKNDHLLYRYQLKRKLGYGSYGAVIKAYDHKCCKFVAVKIFRFGKCFDASAQREYDILKYLHDRDGDDTKNIVCFYEKFSFRRHSIISFELLECDLASLMRNNKNGCDMESIRKILKCILTGLDFIHSNHLIHADIKPGNIGIKSTSTMECKVSS